jgi:hypothetical protein
VSWQSWFNQLRSAWGLRWWGKKLGNADWVDKADKMLNLALAAPVDRGACPTTYQSRQRTWKGTLIAPDPKCYYDLTNIAWKGIWMLRWLEFPDCPRRDEIIKRCKAMAELMISKQNKDGSIPTWLDKDLNVVPVLDHSAQTALPAWFLAEMAKGWDRGPVRFSSGLQTPEIAGRQEAADLILRDSFKLAALKAADFLAKEVVDQQRWYDFETFFSCSPKTCLQRNGKIDDVLMHDPHSMSPPQNTLCMQWAAEALMAADRMTAGTRKSLQMDADPLLPLDGRGWVGVNANNPTDIFASYLEPASTRSPLPNPPHQGEGVSKYRSAAMKALNIMALYQNAWDISYRKTAYDFGGFGVQNSDGEYNDARQAQFGCTMADFGAQLGRQDLFERGVAATRASLALINHPLHDQYGIYPNPNYPLGLQPENDCHGGNDGQAGRTGFDWGEGSGLASMAWLLDKYGETYSGKGWSVLVDGGSKAIELIRANPVKVLTDPSFTFDDWQMKGWVVDGNFPEVPTYSTRLGFGLTRGEGFIGTCEDGNGSYDDRFEGDITSPRFVVTKGKIKLLVGGGSLEKTYVELLDSDHKQIYVERGHDSERMDERTWDVSKYKGQELQIRIVDKEIGGWGHINVARIRCTD